jgi:hypothetical protein
MNLHRPENSEAFLYPTPSRHDAETPLTILPRRPVDKSVYLLILQSYIDKCTRKERMGIIWWKAGIWKLRGIMRGFERGRCPLCLGEEDAKRIILKCLETKTWREDYVNRKWLNTNEDLAYKKIINCINVTRIKSLGKYLFKTKCKWENKVRGGHNPTPRVEEVRS